MRLLNLNAATVAMGPPLATFRHALNYVHVTLSVMPEAALAAIGHPSPRVCAGMILMHAIACDGSPVKPGMTSGECYSL
jgi:hypothetical protein